MNEEKNEEKKWNKIKKEKNKNYSTKIKLNAKEKNSKKKKETTLTKSKIWGTWTHWVSTKTFILLFPCFI